MGKKRRMNVLRLALVFIMCTVLQYVTVCLNLKKKFVRKRNLTAFCHFVKNRSNLIREYLNEIVNELHFFLFFCFTHQRSRSCLSWQDRWQKFAIHIHITWTGVQYNGRRKEKMRNEKEKIIKTLKSLFLQKVLEQKKKNKLVVI